MQLSREEVDRIDATPSKRIYRSIIADYDLNTALCELIDNAIDASVEAKAPSLVRVALTIDVDQQSIHVADNCGGVPELHLRKLISPGESSVSGDGGSIGIFGVGSKRAVVALSQMIRVTTRHKDKPTFRLEYDDEWLKSPDWELSYYKVADIAAGTTEIALSNLRFRIEQSDIDSLRRHLGMTYAHFVQNGQLEITLNQEIAQARFFNQWAHPPKCPPESFVKWLTPINGEKKVRFEITGGLTIEGGSVGGDYGVYVYCNKRLVARALRTTDIGFTSGVAGIPHPRMSLARIVVEFDGPSGNMPWLSNKAGINYNHEVFRRAKADIIQMVKTFTGFSKALQQDFETEVQPFASGEIRRHKLEEDIPIRPSNLPKLPPRRVNYRDAVIELNRKIAEEKPWTRGLYESVIAFQLLTKERRLEQRNRLLLIILDSTLEIACKEYLANEAPQPLNDEKLLNLFKDRTQVHREVEKHVLTGDSIWQRVAYFYRLRCDLIHRRANVSISDRNIEDFRKAVVKILHKGFKIRFPQFTSAVDID